MKTILHILTLLFIPIFSQATIQATIKPNPTTPNAVDVYFKSDVAEPSFHYANNIQISIGISNATTPAPSPQNTSILGGTPTGPQIGITGTRPNITFNSLGMPTLAMLIDDVGGQYIYLFNFVGNGNVVSYAAGEEKKILTVEFQNITTGPDPRLTASINSLADGGPEGQTYFYVENGGGDATNAAAPFYNSGPVPLDTTYDISGGDTLFTHYVYYGTMATNGGCLDYTCMSKAVIDTYIISLPLHLISFEAHKSNASVQLEWVTVNEIDVDHFSVERSADGLRFDTEVANAISIGGFSRQEYKAFDIQPMSGFNYYRLKSVDVSGNFEYSPIRTVYFEKGQQFLASIAPNPVGQNGVCDLIIQSSEEADAAYSIVDATGRVVATQRFHIQTGVSHYPVNLSSLSAGNYFMILSGNGNTIIIRINKI